MPRLLPRCLPLLLSLFLLVRQSVAESQTDLLARFVAAREETGLTSPSTKPWHISVSFELLDADGKEHEHGTFEEWWASPTHWRQQYKSPGFTRERARDGGHTQVSSQQPTPYLLSLMVEGLLSPLPHFGRENPVLQLHDRTVDKERFDCLTANFYPSNKNINESTLPVYCFDHESNYLRIAGRSGIETVLFNRPGHFQARRVSLDLTVLEDRSKALHAAVTSLNTITDDDPQLAGSSGLVPSDRSGQPAFVSDTPKKLRGEQPILPIGMDPSKRKGTVLLDIGIDQGGHVTSVEPVFTTDPNLQNAAIAAVKSWVFQPYTLDGQTTAIVTLLRVNFATTR